MSDEPKINVTALKRALIEVTGPGKQWSRRGLSLAAGMGADGVRDILSGKSKMPTYKTVVRLAEEMGREASDFLAVAPIQPKEVIVNVIGTVEAGVWREDNPGYDMMGPAHFVSAPLPGYENAKRFGLRVIGYSMDLVFPPSSLLDCLDIYSAGVKPISGDFVIVERKQGDLRETTVKEYNIRTDGTHELLPRSSRPEFQERIEIGRPDRNHHDDNETRVIAIVVGNYVPRMSRLMK